MQDNKFHARFYDNYLAIVLIATYIASDLRHLPKRPNLYLSLCAFLFYWVRNINYVRGIVADILCRRKPWSVSVHPQPERACFRLTMDSGIVHTRDGPVRLLTHYDFLSAQEMQILNVAFGLP